jgi:putative hemin transport protein
MSSALSSSDIALAAGLAGRWRAYRAEQPKVRIRDAARALGASEAELVATGVGDTAVRLAVKRWGEVIEALPALGRVMALTRNDQCVHERHGIYGGGEGGEISMNGHAGLVLGPDIDLRLFLRHWRFGFAVRECGAASEKAGRERRSLQFFDAAGHAVHKVYATAETDMAAVDALVARFAAADQSPALAVEVAPVPGAARPDGEIDVEGLRAAWRGLQDTHDFFPLLKMYKVQRTQALRLAGRELAEPLKVSAARRTLELAAERQVPIMIFVGNRGCIQIHTGTVTNLKPAGPWFNVLDPEFNLHLREDRIASAWIVHKPTTDGAVTSVELFDAAGETIALLFGKRKPGVPEKPEWRDVVASVRAAEAM